MQTTSSSIEKLSSNNEKISLSERTRGTNRIFIFSNGKLESTINGKNTNQELTSNDWAKILKSTDKINIENISKLESPSTKRYTDAALASVITITKNGTEYKSSAFDSGNPPTELKSLYDKIQKLIETKKSR